MAAEVISIFGCWGFIQGGEELGELVSGFPMAVALERAVEVAFVLERNMAASSATHQQLVSAGDFLCNSDRGSPFSSET